MGRNGQNLIQGDRRKRANAPEEIVAENAPIQCHLNQIGEIELVKIESRKDIHYVLWKRLIEQYHYLGRGKLYGLQMRYLIKSERLGWIGAMSFNSPAWRIQARDRWIGWDEKNRLKHLNQVVCNSRFLILPNIHVANLASHIL